MPAIGARLVYWPKRLAYCGYALSVVVVGGNFSVSWPHLAALSGIALAAIEWWLRRQVQTHLRRFDRQLVEAVKRGQLSRLRALYRRQYLLRFAAPRHIVLAKQGFIHRKLGDERAALRAYSAALEEAPGEQASQLALPLAELHYAVGDFVAAERCYRRCLPAEHVDPHVHCRLAEMIVQRAGDRGEAMRLLRIAVDAIRTRPQVAELRCQLALLLLRLGQVSDARAQLDQAEAAMDRGASCPGELLEQTRTAVAGLAAARSDQARLRDP